MKQKEWIGVLTKQQAIRLIDRATSHDDPYWEHLVDDYYDEESDTMPSLFHVFIALGVTKEEYMEATNAENVNWPEEPKQ